ncbi:hypothetical protein HMPREF9104_02405 [Lentilactobacillus kisonensis F0435]|uniref:Uncharacterized protein n=1 Tax=Lentilactobacillus kisonensis F0435 TaxID=797516 RepID=H1LIG3_9LACO|nr:hypothetical protein HMPREF9104_02405 [Lentilactobacillus kisonensis F0435]
MAVAQTTSKSPAIINVIQFIDILLKISERNKAVRTRSISLRQQEFPVLEFLLVVLMCRVLLCAAVLKENGTPHNSFKDLTELSKVPTIAARWQSLFN